MKRTTTSDTQPALFALLEPAPAKAAPAAAVPARPRARAAAPAKPPKPIAKPARAAKTTPALAKAPAKTSTVKMAKTPPTKSPAQTVRVVNEPVFEGGALWKMSGKNGVAYIKDATLAGELLAVDPKKLAQAAMAVYYDKKGKAFAWQVRFDTARWDEILRRLA